MRQWARRLLMRYRRNKRVATLYVVGGALVMIIILQVLLFAGRLPLFAAVDGRAVGGWHASDAVWQLERDYEATPLVLALKDSQQSIRELPAKEAGLVVPVADRIKTSAMPLWLRLIPTSPLWSGMFVRPAEPETRVDEAARDKFMEATFGSECFVPAQNAGLQTEGEALRVVASRDGIRCQRDDVVRALGDVRLVRGQPYQLKLPADPVKPTIDDKTAEALKTMINDRLAQGVEMKAGEKKVVIARANLVQWLRVDNQGEALQVTLDQGASGGFFNEHVAPLVSRQPGVSKVTTHDFVEVARVNGANGAGLDYAGTRAGIAAYLTGQADAAMAKTTVVPPRVEYTRTYSATDTGFSAMLKHTTEGRSGRHAVAVIELSGKRRSANANGDEQFVSASTYKLFVAFSVLKRIEDGRMSWGDQVSGGRDANRCFDDMIVRSDNACPEAWIQKMKPSQLQADVVALGLKGTNFLDKEAVRTTAHDLVKFVAMLESRQLPISRAAQDKLIAAMRRNIYRQGIPAGASGPVANKVGFLSGYLNDAGIVYAPNGTYAVAVLTEGSTWGAIADITKKIEAFRQS